MISKVNAPATQPHTGGGGLWGKVGTAAGMALGAIIGGLATGGTGVGAGAMAGAGLGGTAGGLTGSLAGEALDPTVGSIVPGGPNPVNIRKIDVAMKIPEVQMAQMQRSKQLLAQSNIPNAMDYMKMIDSAQEKKRQEFQMGGGGGFLG